jgi:hypothetical protein
VLRETWSLGDVRDVEAFAGDVIAKFTRGERAAHKPGTDAFLSPADKDDLLAFLLGASWEAWLKFNPIDDGRGTNRFSGYLVWVLHRRVVDWIRQTKGSTRYPNSRIVTELVPLTPTIEERLAPFLDPEYDDGDYGLDLDVAPPGTREALELLQPLIDDDAENVKQVAERAHAEPRQVVSALALVRAAARRQGLEPDDEERHALADQARDLREQRMTYRQIAGELRLHSSHTATALIRDYYPELIKPATRRAATKRKPTPVIASGPMKSRDGQRNPCVYCQTPTIFIRAIAGSNSTHPEWEDCCADCGERPARREQLAMTAA